MQPIRTRAARALTVAAGTALALSLGACGLLGGDQGDEEAPPNRPWEAAQSADAGGGPEGISSEGDGLTVPGEGSSTKSAEGSSEGDPEGDSADDESGDESGEGSDNGREGVGPEDGEPRTASLAGDDSIEIDEDGNGVVPKEALAIDIEDLFVNKYDIPVEEVTCSDDMKIVAERGSQNCEIVTADRTYFGTTAIVGFDGEMVEYELYFPGLDEDALDLADD